MTRLDEDETDIGAAIGDIMKDGTIYAGDSPSTHLPIYAAPADAPTCMAFGKAEKYAKGLSVGGKKDFHLPDKEELQVLFDNRDKGALKRTLNVTGSDTAGWYLSSAPGCNSHAYGVRFSDGAQGYSFGLQHQSSVRCVR
jgi:hypothetical protein